MEAREECQRKGGVLARPMSYQEQGMISKAIKVKELELEKIWKTYYNRYLNIIYGYDKFIWINLEEDFNNKPKGQLPYRNYGSGQPNNAGIIDQACVAIDHSSDDTWNDYWCNETLPLVCQFPSEY